MWDVRDFEAESAKERRGGFSQNKLRVTLKSSFTTGPLPGIYRVITPISIRFIFPQLPIYKVIYGGYNPAHHLTFAFTNLHSCQNLDERDERVTRHRKSSSVTACNTHTLLCVFRKDTNTLQNKGFAVNVPLNH